MEIPGAAEFLEWLDLTEEQSKGKTVDQSVVEFLDLARRKLALEKSLRRQERRDAQNERRRILNNARTAPTCYGCGLSHSSILHMHHVLPIGSYQVPCRETVWLCPNCHALVHERIRMDSVFLKKRSNSYYKKCLPIQDAWLKGMQSDDLKWHLLSELAKGVIYA